ncbi:hydroxymethylglutaryl-CoA reductase, degradative [Lactobacillaceae bacterium L1_55_11]|nr:hydroxymethylglutaryl-CoA reductase, degradative [Lactobacillaceae bacterium L1_55_11]
MAKKFYQLSPDERIDRLTVSKDTKTALKRHQSRQNSQLIENYISDYNLPLGLLGNLIVDSQGYTVPMVTEEPSVVAAANNGARLLGLQGGVTTTSQESLTTVGQLLFAGVNADDLADFVVQHRDEIDDAARRAKSSIYRRGGGLVDVTVRSLPGQRTSVDFAIDTQAAMGANIVNTILEGERSVFDPFADRFVAAILSNYSPHQVITAQGKVAVADLGGQDIARKIAALSDFGGVDIYRATTENKGIYNGIAAVTLATGNDTRAISAAGHAWAAGDGQYHSLSHWQLSEDGTQLLGELTLPLPVGTVGGAIGALPSAQTALEILGNPDGRHLRGVLVAVGLAQNLAALKALSGEGIQAGHMRMQARALALQVGAQPDEVGPLVAALAEAEQLDSAVAQQKLEELRQHESQNSNPFRPS